VALGSVYTYFGSREELFAALYTERLVALHDELAPIVASARSLEQLFVGVAGAYLDVYRVYGREVNLWSAIADASDLPRELAQPLVDAATRVLALVGAGVSRHAGVRLERPDLALPFLWATLNGLCDHFTGHRHELHGFTWDELAGFAARTLVAGLTKKERP
jgi:AcrR family transcriptional regulator